MRRLLMLVFVLALSLNALATADRMGVSGDPESEMPLILVYPVGVFPVYVCIFEPSVNSIAAFECSLEFTESELMFVLNTDLPNGGINFGSGNNLIVGFPTPVPAADVTVVATINILVVGAPMESLAIMGPADPSSFGGEAPGYADGEDFDHLVPCWIPDDGVVGTITTEVLAVEARSLSQVKALFD